MVIFTIFNYIAKELLNYTSKSKEYMAITLDEERNKAQQLVDYNIYNIPISDFFKSAFSVDCVVYGFDGTDFKVLLIQRGAEPYKGQFALPGDLVYPNEDLSTSANRVLQELTGLSDVYLQQHRTFGAVDRHPLGRVITISHFALVNIEHYNPTSSSWAQNAHWHSMKDLPRLAFDHEIILREATLELRKRVRVQPIGFELLPVKFSLNQLQLLYEAILDKTFDKANFRKKILSMKFLEELDEREQNVNHRPARLYRFNPDIYASLKKEGFSFEL